MNQSIEKKASVKPITIGIVGVRGYVGRELIDLLSNQTQLKVEWVSSRQLEGKPLSELLKEDDSFRAKAIDEQHYFHQLKIQNLHADEVAALKTDIIVLALPNGLASDFVTKIEQNNSCKLILDLSADYRFDESWIYSLPEVNTKPNIDYNHALNSKEITKISNPGCYATAMQIAIAPLIGKILGRVNCFGISGFSGAGTKPSANNDPKNLKDNIIPYGLIEHLHEKEVSYQLNQPVSFSPHVASFFRGINMTVQIELKTALTESEVNKLFAVYYKSKSFVKVMPAIPTIQQVNHTPFVAVGGFKVSKDGKRLVVICCLDNLLKGAASQALQNIALACQLDIDILGVN